MTKLPNALVLTRKLGDDIVCTLPDGDEIIIRYVKQSGKKISLCISAPRNVSIYRRDNYREVDEYVGNRPIVRKLRES